MEQERESVLQPWMTGDLAWNGLPVTKAVWVNYSRSSAILSNAQQPDCKMHMKWPKGESMYGSEPGIAWPGACKFVSQASR